MNTYQASQTLNIVSDASFEDIKYAYRKLVLELHPDKNINESDGKKFNRVTEAYHYLKNNHKRQNSKKRDSVTSEWKYADTKSETKQTFKRRSGWEAPPGGKPPEEDWSKFTKEFEDTDPKFWKQYEKEFWGKYEAGINKNGSKGKGFERNKKTEPNVDLSVFVDASLCIGCCSCETIAPEVFTVDKLSKMNPKSHVYNEKGAGYQKIMNAAETCPTKAINVGEKATGKKLFPW